MRSPQPILEERDRQAIKQIFEEKLTGPVTIQFFTQPPSLLTIPGRDCASCEETARLLGEVADLSDQITIEEHDFRTDYAAAEDQHVGRIPAFILRGKARGAVRFFGLPAGYEFSSLIEGLTAVSSGETRLSPETREALAKLKDDVHIQVFSTPG